jgi:glycosyltransferase involved in cell wall biosynthesis
MNITHVITGLNQGGAEGALVRLVCQSTNPAEHTVISLMDDDIHGAALRASDTRVITLGAHRGSFSISDFYHLIAAIRESNPDVVQTWMYHADLLGGLAAKQLGIPVVWGVRMSNNSIHDLGFKTWLVAKACALLSYAVPHSIVGCSHRGIALHRKFGYSDRFVYIPNGFNFATSNALIVHSDVHSPPVLGHAARFHPIKGHAVFLNALEHLKLCNQAFQARMVGSDVLESNPEFSAIIPPAVAEHIEAIGPQSDMPGFYKTCDVFVLSSHGEAFPKVVAEAMLAGLPCIVTDVGDAADIVGDTGWVVPAKDPRALSAAMHQAIAAMANADAWAARKAAASARITNLYSMDKMQSRFEAAWTAAMEN